MFTIAYKKNITPELPVPPNILFYSYDFTLSYDSFNKFSGPILMYDPINEEYKQIIARIDLDNLISTSLHDDTEIVKILNNPTTGEIKIVPFAESATRYEYTVKNYVLYSEVITDSMFDFSMVSAWDVYENNEYIGTYGNLTPPKELPPDFANNHYNLSFIQNNKNEVFGLYPKVSTNDYDVGTTITNIFVSFNNFNIKLYHFIKAIGDNEYEYSKLYLVNDKEVIAISKNICEYKENEDEYMQEIMKAEWESVSVTNIKIFK